MRWCQKWDNQLPVVGRSPLTPVLLVPIECSSVNLKGEEKDSIFKTYDFVYASGSPAVEFYVTQLDHTSYPQHPTPFYNDVLVQTDSNITLTCTAKEPAHGYPEWYFGTDLQPYLINWFANSSLLLVPNCDRTSRKVKTCSLSLVKVSPRDQGKYFCQAANQMGCTFQELDLKVISGRLLWSKRLGSRGMKISTKECINYWQRSLLVMVRGPTMFYVERVFT